MPTPNHTQPEPQTVSFPIVPDFAAAMGIFGCHIDHQGTREMLIDTGRNIDAALAVAVEEIDTAWDKIAELTNAIQEAPMDDTNDNGPSVEEWIADSRTAAIARIQAAAKGDQA